MMCERCDQWLQDLLDGAEPDAALLEHLPRCAACRDLYESGVALARGVRLFPRPQPPEGLTDRIVTAVRVDRRRRQRFRLTWARVAVVVAAVLLAWLVTLFRPQPRQEKEKEVVVNPPERPAPSLRETVVNAGSAVVDRARREVGEVVENTFTWPLGESILPETDIGAELESTTRPLRDAGQGVGSGLEPVTGSARRAFALFMRDLTPAPLKTGSGS
jgi:predicted anti-sigma-YlaC factor YlaD